MGWASQVPLEAVIAGDCLVVFRKRLRNDKEVKGNAPATATSNTQ